MQLCCWQCSLRSFGAAKPAAILCNAAMQGLAQTVHSFGKLEQPADRLCTLAVAAAVTPDSQWKTRDWVDLLWGCARLKHFLHPDSVQALEAMICQILRGSGGATLAILPGLLIASLSKNRICRTSSLSTPQCSSSFWRCADSISTLSIQVQTCALEGWLSMSLCLR